MAIFTRKKDVSPSALRYFPPIADPEAWTTLTRLPMVSNSKSPNATASLVAGCRSLQNNTANDASSGKNNGITSNIASAPQLSQLRDIQMIERVSYAEYEQSHQEHSHEEIECDSDLDDEGHAECRDQSSEEDTVFKHQK